jgi:outer membrane protein TolC
MTSFRFLSSLRCRVLALLLTLHPSAALYAQDAPVPVPALDLDGAVARALRRQPQLEALAAEASAMQHRAEAADQLPDPRLTLGITDVPVEGPDRYSLRRESDTQISAGLRQDFPRAQRRVLQRERALGEAQVLEAEREAAARLLARETGLAWLDAWKAEAASGVTLQSLTEAERQADAARIAYTAAQVNQAEWMAAQLEADALRDELEAYAQQSRHARNQLSRWIGQAAFDPIDPVLPAETPPDAAALIAALRQHPHLQVEARRLALSETDVRLAIQDYRPDWALTVGYGHRAEFADVALLQLELPLPVFPGRRQDPRLQSARDMVRAQAGRLEDQQREHEAEIRLNADDWQRLQQRLRYYDERLLPQAQVRIEAATAAYGAAAGTLKSVLDARRFALELALQKLELQADAAKHQLQLRYFAP